MLKEILEKTLMITSFVAAMMLIIEYVNVQTRGIVLRTLKGSRLRQYLVASLLGASPGCLGAFVVVALFAHRKLALLEGLGLDNRFHADRIVWTGCVLAITSSATPMQSAI